MKTGIWIDKEKAHIVTLNETNEELETIESNVDTFHVSGGSGRGQWGPQDVVQDSKYLEREKHQLRAYFNTVAEHLKDCESIVIFGPAETNSKLYKDLQEHHKAISSKVKEVKKADSMTTNQVKAWVRNYYNQNV
ncbi:pelota family protein [Mangrovimonas aestuarii]|uniref:hypothetical protein n=1 Tax=Mangrovimonas aestuarii TaxID=3018443 RepID=UPI0023790166|nr:hypothetical protein [Mangrovimonas aestuarii]